MGRTEDVNTLELNGTKIWFLVCVRKLSRRHQCSIFDRNMSSMSSCSS
jgi:hypothetical protein